MKPQPAAVWVAALEVVAELLELAVRRLEPEAPLDHRHQPVGMDAPDGAARAKILEGMVGSWVTDGQRTDGGSFAYS